MSDADLATNLRLLRGAVQEIVGGPAAEAAARVIDHGLEALPELPATRESFLATSEAPHAELARDYLRLLLAGDRRGASALILGAVRDGVSVRDVYLHVFQRTQYEIGRLWQLNEISVAQEHFCTAATQMIMSQLYPQIFASARVGRRLVAACVGGDLHEIGVRMVADFFEMAGWDTFYLGANTPLPGVLQAVEEHRPDAIAISATMSYHVGEVAALIRALRERDGRAPRILVGGYPFAVDPELWRTVGADGGASDAAAAVALAERLVRAA
jgi:methanogenic corrinoid protein MtbC1